MMGDVKNINKAKRRRPSPRHEETPPTEPEESQDTGPVFFVPRFVYTACLWWFALSGLVAATYAIDGWDYAKVVFNVALWGYCLVEREKRDRVVFGPSPYEARRGW